MKYLILIALLVIIIIISTGCVNRNIWFENCNGVQYDIRHQTCCGNTVYKFDEMEGFFCCGASTGKLYERHPSPGSSFYCCGETVYNWSDQTCCNNEFYNSTTQHCCNGKVESGGGTWPICGNQCYDPTTQHCCIGKVESGGGSWYICGNQCYDPTIQGCCNNQIYDFTTQSCCVVHEGDEYYTPSSPWPLDIMKIHEGKNSCCVGSPSQINGTFCQPNSGNYASPDSSGSGCNTFECSMQKNWRDQESNRQVGRALGMR